MTYRRILRFNLIVSLLISFAFAVYAGDVSFETGDILTEKSNELFLSLKNTEAGGHDYRLVSAGSLGGIGVGKFGIYDATTGLTRLTIDTSGKVGIGTTVPGTKFHIGGLTDGGIGFLSTGIQIDSRASLGVPRIYRHASGWLTLDNIPGGGDQLVLASGGNVGIGTTNPDRLLHLVTGNVGLHLQSNTAAPTHLWFENTAQDWALGIDTVNGNNFAIGPNANGDPRSNQLVSITPGGNVGIGTTNPNTKLDVSGEIKVGNSGTVCNANSEGAIRYNSASKVLEYCDGTGWKAIDQNAVGVGGVTLKQCSVDGSATETSTTACSKPTCDEVSQNTYDTCSEDASCANDHFMYINDVKLEGTIAPGGSVTPSIEVRCWSSGTEWAIYFHDGNSWTQKCSGSCSVNQALQWHSCNPFNLPVIAGMYYLRGIEAWAGITQACEPDSYGDHDDIKIQI